MSARELPAHECRRFVDPSTLPFQSTDEVNPVSGMGAQERALAALELGLEIREPRFHVVVVGPPGSGRTFCARAVAKRIAARMIVLFDVSDPRGPIVTASSDCPQKGHEGSVART